MKRKSFKEMALAINPNLIAQKNNTQEWVVGDKDTVFASSPYRQAAWHKAYLKAASEQFKAGDQVVMVNCIEAEFHKDKVWTCRTDSFKACGDDYAVFLVGFSGYFYQEFLQKK